MTMRAFLFLGFCLALAGCGEEASDTVGSTEGGAEERTLSPGGVGGGIYDRTPDNPGSGGQ